MEQNVQLWMVPGKQSRCCLAPGKAVDFDFVECLDGKFSYEVWMLTAASPNSFLELILNGETLYSFMRLPEGKTAFWNLFGSFLVPKGEHRMTLVNRSDHEICLEGVLVTRDAGYIHSKEADWHRQRMLDGEDVEALLREKYAVPEEKEENRRTRLAQLSEMGFLERDDQKVSEGICRCGVPMGGIGAGKVELDADGVFTAITINNNQDVPIYRTDGSFFGLWYQDDTGSNAWVLQKNSYLTRRLPGVSEITYRGRFPRAELEFPELPLKVKLDAFSALVPYQVKDSALPGVIYTVTLENTGNKQAEAAVLFSWENLLGTGGTMVPPKQDSAFASYIMNTWNPGYTWCNRKENRQTPIENGLHYTGGSQKEYPSAAGEYVILCDGKEKVSCRSSWNPETEAESFWQDFAADGVLTEQPFCPVTEPFGHTAGALSRKMILKPGEKVSCRFVLSWYLPELTDGRGQNAGVYYTNHFKNAREVAAYLMAHGERLWEETVMFERLLEKSSLPRWMTEKLINDRFPIYTCSWFDREGNFSINEAPTGMMGCLGTMDQRLACCSLYTNLFPQLDKKELQLFADTQGEDGSVSHDLGNSFIRKEPCKGTWSDLNSSFVLQIYKYYLYTADSDFLQEMFPRVKAAVSWQLTTDFDRNFIPDVGPGHGTTYDTYHWYGNSAFVAILWLAELKAGAALGILANDLDFAKECDTLFERAQQSVLTELWDDRHDYGGYFDNYHGKAQKSENCFIAQLAGQWFADLLGLGDLLPAEKITEALRTIYQRNLKLHNIRLMNDETTPEGDFYGYAYTFLQYDEVYYGCLAIARGQVKEGLECFRRVYEASVQPWNVGLTYRTDGSLNGLPYYMTNPASLFFLDALSGWIPDAVHHCISFAPQNLPETETEKAGVCSLPLFSPVLWVSLSWQSSHRQKQFQIEVLRIENAEFDTLRFKIRDNETQITANGEPVPCLEEKGWLVCKLERPVKAGEKIEIVVQ